jgi:hypothetical protein
MGLEAMKNMVMSFVLVWVLKQSQVLLEDALDLNEEIRKFEKRWTSN